jgi:putative PEP-CTERM system TPR-repeat lipoprotein
MRTTQPLALLLGSALLVASCQKSPEAAIRKGDTFFQEGHYKEAILEYRNALQINQQLGEVHLKLGDTYAKNNDGLNAIKEYIRAADLLPENNDAQLKAASGLLLAGRFDEARGRADKVLERDKQNVRAQILRGNALANLKDLDGAITEYENAIAADPKEHQAFVNLGTIQFMKGNREESEKAFLQAVTAAPKSIEARLGLANFYWASRRAAEAEQALKEALAIDPASLIANRALGIFYMATNKVADAEPYFKSLATTVGTPASMASLAQYYVLANRRDDARKILTGILQQKDGASIATIRLAALDASDGQRAAAQDRLRTYLVGTPTDLPAQLMYAELLLLDAKRDDAEKVVKAAIALDANSALAHQLAGQIYALNDRIDEAEKEYERVLQIDPRPYQAALELSRLHLAQGNVDKSTTYAQQALALAPQSPDAQSMLVRTYLVKGERDKAAAIVASLQKQYPNATGLHNLNALIELSKNNPAGARASYAKSLEIDRNNVEALNGIVRIDVAGKRVKEATDRLDDVAAQPTPSVDLLFTVATGYALVGAFDKSEAALKRALERDPARLKGYTMLGQLYAQTRRLADAKTQFQDLVKRNPNSVPAWTMIGMIEEAQGLPADAQKSYAHALSLDKRAAVAANNLAWLYVSSGTKLEEALALAQSAAEQIRDEPAVNDTLGWIYVKKDMGGRAIPLLESAVKASPNDPTFRYHLGTAYFKSSDWKKARVELEKALELNPKIAQADEIRKALAIVGGSPTQ